MTLPMPPGWGIDEINRWLHYHGETTRTMTRMRTALESRLIPITAYILVSAVECYRRHPELVLQIDQATRAEDIGAAARIPGNQVDSVHIWSQANIFLLGRNVLIMLGLITPDHEPERTAIVLNFWRRVASAFRGDGKLQAFDANLTCTPYKRDTVDELVRGSEPVAADAWLPVTKLNATLSSYMFLLYFDTRSGMVDTGPYPLDDGRVLLARDFSKMGPSDFWWASDLEVPYENLTAAFVLRDVDVDVNDWGTSVTRPENYLDHVERFGLFTTDNGPLEPVPLDRVDDIRAATRTAQSKLYRDIAAMSHKERIDAGAYVYFSFLKPFADVAGAAALDWAVPRESLDVYDMLSMFDGTAEAPAETNLPYYTPFPT